MPPSKQRRGQVQGADLGIGGAAFAFDREGLLLGVLGRGAEAEAFADRGVDRHPFGQGDDGFLWSSIRPMRCASFKPLLGMSTLTSSADPVSA